MAKPKDVPSDETGDTSPRLQMKLFGDVLNKCKSQIILAPSKNDEDAKSESSSDCTESIENKPVRKRRRVESTDPVQSDKLTPISVSFSNGPNNNIVATLHQLSPRLSQTPQSLYSPQSAKLSICSSIRRSKRLKEIYDQFEEINFVKSEDTITYELLEEFNDHESDLKQLKRILKLSLIEVLAEVLPAIGVQEFVYHLFNLNRSAIVLMKKNCVIATVVYVVHYDYNLIELIFFCVAANEQLKGYGNTLMTLAKSVFVQKHKIDRVVTFADVNAVKFFQKHKFTFDSRLTESESKIIGHYKHAKLMQCNLQQSDNLPSFSTDGSITLNKQCKFGLFTQTIQIPHLPVSSIKSTRKRRRTTNMEQFEQLFFCLRSHPYSIMFERGHKTLNYKISTKFLTLKEIEEKVKKLDGYKTVGEIFYDILFLIRSYRLAFSSKTTLHKFSSFLEQTLFQIIDEQFKVEFPS